MQDAFKLVFKIKIQGPPYPRIDLIRKHIVESIPKVIFRGDLEPDLAFEHYRKTGIATKNLPGFD